MGEYLLIIISAIFVNNILLAQFLGICPFLGVSNKLSTAAGMSGAVCFVITRDSGHLSAQQLRAGAFRA